MERGEMGGMHEGAKKMHVLKENLRAIKECCENAFSTLSRGKDELSDADLEAIQKNLIESEAAVSTEYETLKSEMSSELKSKLEEWNRLVVQEQTLFDDVAERLHSFTAEEYGIILDQMKDVHERRKKMSVEVDEMFESLES